MTPYELDFRVAGRDVGLTVVEVAGELDLTNAADVERDLTASVDGEEGLVLDLNRVSFIDSAALHMLFRIARRAAARHRLAIVLEPDAPIARTLAIVGLDAVATFRASLDELVETAS